MPELRGTWILKGSLSCCGNNLEILPEKNRFFFENLARIVERGSYGEVKLGPGESFVLQNYVENPLLRDGRKVEIQSFLLIKNKAGRAEYYFNSGLVIHDPKVFREDLSNEIDYFSDNNPQEMSLGAVLNVITLERYLKKQRELYGSGPENPYHAFDFLDQFTDSSKIQANLESTVLRLIEYYDLYLSKGEG